MITDGMITTARKDGSIKRIIEGTATYYFRRDGQSIKKQTIVNGPTSWFRRDGSLRKHRTVSGTVLHYRVDGTLDAVYDQDGTARFYGEDGMTLLRTRV